MGTDLEGPSLPKAPKRKTGAGNEQAKAIGMEMAAMAYVAMEMGTYQPLPGSHAGPNGGVNKHELMRLAGYSRGSWNEFERTLGQKREFWQLVELYRLRRTDPRFGKEQRNRVIGDIVEKLSLELLEAIEFYPHTISFRDKVMALKTIVDCGYKVVEAEEKRANRSDELLDKLSPEQRAVAIKGMQERAAADLERLRALEDAHKAADDGH